MASTEDQNSSSSFSALMITGILIACLGMIGMTGYIKHQIDKSESQLVAPDQAFSPEQEMYEKTVVALGYSGFLGSAQHFMSSRDRAALGDMRMNFKTAQETITRASDKASNAVRRDLKAIMDIFADIITKAEEGGDAMSVGITNIDILTASAALATLDNRLQSALAGRRMEAHAEMKNWGLAMMLVAWGSLVLLALSASAIVLVYRNRKSIPMRSLTQSIENMAQGDLDNPVWGLERSDAIGDMARSLDKLRLFYSQVPDVTVDTEDGPLRFKFEGETRTLFQAMMKSISETFERTQQTAVGYTSAIGVQQDMLTAVATHMNSVLSSMQLQSSANEESLRNLSHSLTESARSLTETQSKGVAEIGRLVPYLQERIQNMAEVTHLAGSHVTQSLQTLSKAETALRSSATQSQQVVQQLSSSTNQMGERMFAALNLMQASGKLLNQTTEGVKTRFNEAVQALGRGEGHLKEIITRAENRLASTVNAEENMAALAARTESSAEKMERAVNNIYERHEGLSEQVVTATHRMESIVASFDSAQRAMSDAVSQVRRDGSLINSLLMELRANNEQLIESVSQNSMTNFNSVQNLAEKSHALMQRLEVQIQQQAQTAETHLEDLSTHSKIMVQQTNATGTTLAQAITGLKGEQEKLSNTRSKFSEIISDLGNRFEQQATATFGKTEQWAAQSFTKLSTIAEQVESVMQRLGMLGQLTSTLGTVAGQLGQLVPSLTNLQAVGHAANSGVPTIINMDETKDLIIHQTEDMLAKLQEQWHESVIQIEAMHDQLAQLVIQQKDQLETRLVVMDKKMKEVTQGLAADFGNDVHEQKHGAIINELLSAVKEINQHVMDIDNVIEDAGLRKEA
jgi:methyl-accepting chemotaxis protein